MILSCCQEKKKKIKFTCFAILAWYESSLCKRGKCVLKNGNTKGRKGKFVASCKLAWNSSIVMFPFCNAQNLRWKDLKNFEDDRRAGQRILTTMLKTKARTFSPSSGLISAPNWTRVLRNLLSFPRLGLLVPGVAGGEALPALLLFGDETNVEEGGGVLRSVEVTWLKDGGVAEWFEIGRPSSGLPGDLIPERKKKSPS